MKLNIKKLENNSTIVDNTHENFIGTDLANDTFSIEVKALSRADMIDIAGNPDIIDENGNIKNGQYSKALFIGSLGKITGISDSESGEEFTDEEMTKELVWELAPDEVIETIKNIVSEYTNKEDEKKSDSEALAENIANGIVTENQSV